MSKKFKFFMMLLLACITLPLVSCSDDDESNDLNPNIVGYWYCDNDNLYSAIAYDLKEDGSGTQLRIDNFSNRRPEIYTYDNMWNNNKVWDKTIINITSNTLTLDDHLNPDETYIRITEAQWESLITTGSLGSDIEDSATDALSGTTWKLSSITGWGSDGNNSGYKNMELRFGNNGTVTEWYSSSNSYTGTYTISGSTLTFSASTFLTNDWGYKYNFKISGSTLTLEVPGWDTFFNFTKK